VQSAPGVFDSGARRLPRSRRRRVFSSSCSRALSVERAIIK
jgi:hypothetical protein